MVIINLRVEIKRNSDGDIAVGVFKSEDYDEWMWTGGNYACDCNRALFFSRFKTLCPEIECECGQSEYIVRLSNNDTKEILYDEITHKVAKCSNCGGIMIDDFPEEKGNFICNKCIDLMIDDSASGSSNND